jgi:hypothetical protein
VRSVVVVLVVVVVVVVELYKRERRLMLLCGLFSKTKQKQWVDSLVRQEGLWQ